MDDFWQKALYAIIAAAITLPPTIAYKNPEFYHWAKGVVFRLTIFITVILCSGLLSVIYLRERVEDITSIQEAIEPHFQNIMSIYISGILICIGYSVFLLYVIDPIAEKIDEISTKKANANSCESSN